MPSEGSVEEAASTPSKLLRGEGWRGLRTGDRLGQDEGHGHPKEQLVHSGELNKERRGELKRSFAFFVDFQQRETVVRFCADGDDLIESEALITWRWSKN